MENKVRKKAEVPVLLLEEDDSWQFGSTHSYRVAASAISM
jgi:hypothetical protein